MVIDLFGIEINWPSQIFGIVGAIFCIYAFFRKDKIKYLIFINIGYLFCIGEAVLLLFSNNNTWANIISTVIAIFRNLLLLFYLKKKKMETPIGFAVVFTVLLWVCCIPFYNEWYTFIPSIAMTIATISLFFKNFIVVKITNIIFELLYLFYGIIIGAYTGIIRDGFGMIMCVAAIILYIKDHMITSK